MKASELRVGNWVTDEFGDQVQVFEINEIYASVYEPIPLTPEILEKCGLIRGKFHENRNVYYSTGTHNLKFSILGTNGQILLYSGHKSYSVPFFCEYLHQLQNLYYDLTGEELNYQP